MTFDDLYRAVSAPFVAVPDDDARRWVRLGRMLMGETAIETAMLDYRCSREVAIEILRHRDYSNPSCVVPD